MLSAWWRRWRQGGSLGERGEAVAARFLQRRGYRIVGRNLKDSLGELDLVAVDGRTIVFVEVKTRSATDAGNPAEAVDRDKERRLTRLALAYLRRHGLLECAARFDIVAVTWPEAANRPTVEHFSNAFPANWESMFS